MTAAVPKCPSCGSVNIRDHCHGRGNQTACRWIVCIACDGYGLPDGTRWAPKRQSA